MWSRRALAGGASALLAVVLIAGGHRLESAAVAAACPALIAALVLPAWRRRLVTAAAVLLAAAVLALVAHLLGDDFSYRLAWLYGAPQLPWYLKLTHLWAGDEGILLAMAALGALCLPRLVGLSGWAGAGAILVVLALAFGALVWSPFVQMRPAELAVIPFYGMNAHLSSVWMVFHPPLVLAAYVLLLLPAGAAAQALAGRGGEWRDIAPALLRPSWLALSLGLALGMWWAYQDLTFGQFWHWDPVQTAVFVVWVLLTAQLHCLRGYRLGEGTAFPRLHPLLALAAATAAALAMVVTRLPLLASSHRYVGDTSWPLLALLALALLAASLWAIWAGRGSMRLRLAVPSPLLLAVLLLLGGAAIAAALLGDALAREASGAARDDGLRPFFEMLARWSDATELAALRQAFAQWEVDPYAVNAALTPLGAALFLAGGHLFLPVSHRRWRWTGTAMAAAAAALATWWLEPTRRLFTGTGMTSASTQANFPWLDALLACAAFFLLAAAAWTVVLVRRQRQGAARVRIAVGLLHVGAALALVAFVAATVFDSYAQRMVAFPAEFGEPLAFPDGYQLELSIGEGSFVADGLRGATPGLGFRAATAVSWALTREGRVIDGGEGRSIARQPAPPASLRGAVREMCEILDYRYARFAAGADRLLQPLIHRGLWRDVQVWVPPVGFANEPGGPQPLESHIPVVLKVYPAVTWLWAGLALMIGSAAAVLLLARRR